MMPRASSTPLQLPMWEPQSTWKPPRIGDLPNWKGAKRVGFDVETCDPHLKELGIGVRRDDSYLVGFSFAIEDGPKHYVPLRHAGGDNVEDPEQGLAYLCYQAQHFDGQLVGAHLPYDLDYAAEEGAVFRGSCDAGETADMDLPVRAPDKKPVEVKEAMG